MNFLPCTYKSKKCAQSQLNFAPSHDGEMVKFRNSCYYLANLQPLVFYSSLRLVLQYYMILYKKTYIGFHKH